MDIHPGAARIKRPDCTWMFLRNIEMDLKIFCIGRMHVLGSLQSPVLRARLDCQRAVGCVKGQVDGVRKQDTCRYFIPEKMHFIYLNY
jgi:hypothetical protein